MTRDNICIHFFRGALTRNNDLSYYPLAFILKSPLPFLAFFFVSVVLVLTRKLRFPAWIWLPPLLFFSAFVPFHNAGVRILLPIYPFCILMAARCGAWFWNVEGLRERKVFRSLLIGLLGFQTYSLGSSFSRQISYFNELISGDRKIYWFGDANLDIGQDTKRLAQTAKIHGWSHVKLAYMGQTNPLLYGMKWDYWREKDLTGPQSGWVYAINAEFIQMGPAFFTGGGAILKSWIMDRPPTGKIGDTWYYFDIPGVPEKDSSKILESAFAFNGSWGPNP